MKKLIYPAEFLSVSAKKHMDTQKKFMKKFPGVVTYPGMLTNSPEYLKIQKESMEALWNGFWPKPEQLELELGIFNMPDGKQYLVGELPY